MKIFHYLKKIGPLYQIKTPNKNAFINLYKKCCQSCGWALYFKVQLEVNTSQWLCAWLSTVLKFNVLEVSRSGVRISTDTVLYFLWKPERHDIHALSRVTYYHCAHVQHAFSLKRKFNFFFSYFLLLNFKRSVK